MLEAHLSHWSCWSCLILSCLHFLSLQMVVFPALSSRLIWGCLLCSFLLSHSRNTDILWLYGIFGPLGLVASFLALFSCLGSLCIIMHHFEELLLSSPWVIWACVLFLPFLGLLWNELGTSGSWGLPCQSWEPAAYLPRGISKVQYHIKWNLFVM